MYFVFFSYLIHRKTMYFPGKIKQHFIHFTSKTIQTIHEAGVNVHARVKLTRRYSLHIKTVKIIRVLKTAISCPLAQTHIIITHNNKMNIIWSYRSFIFVQSAISWKLGVKFGTMLVGRITMTLFSPPPLPLTECEYWFTPVSSLRPPSFPKTEHHFKKIHSTHLAIYRFY